MPRHKPKYRLPRAGGRAGPSLLLWLLLLVVLVTAIWFFWPFHKAKTAKTTAPVKKSVVQSVAPAPWVQPLVLKLPPVANPVTKPIPIVVPALPSPATSAPPVVVNPAPNRFPRPVFNPFEAQVALARMAISPGSIDGAAGSQTKLALQQFQRANRLPATGLLDPPTRAALTLDDSPYTDYTVTANDLARLQPIGKTWLEKSEQTALAYETVAELVGEFSHSHPALIRQLNPNVDWAAISTGTVLKIPDVQYPDPSDKAALVIIHLSGKYLEAWDQASNLLLHCPCSIAAHVEKRPVGLLHVVTVIPHPNYTFDPAIFPESPEARAIGHKLVLPPGPNNPVGVAWMGLDRPGYGMHGTPAPEQVGRTESHGCFRLANWDAEYLVKLVWVGMPVQVVP